MPYHTPGGAVDWEHCTLRRWLNGSFYRALPLTVRSRVLEVENCNAANAKHGTHGGNPTVDRVFLLSIDEVERYFPTPTRTDGEAGISELKRLHAFWRAGVPGPIARMVVAALAGQGFPVRGYRQQHGRAGRMPRGP